MNCVTACSELSRILRQISPSVIGTILTRPSALSGDFIRITMSDTRDSHSKPPVTAVALSKKNLPGFSQDRYETSSLSGADACLRSLLGIGCSHGTNADGTPVPPDTGKTTKLPTVNSVSAEDPAIVGWSLQAEVPVSAMQTENDPCSESEVTDSTRVVPPRKSRSRRRKIRDTSAVVPKDETDDIRSPAAVSKEKACEDANSILIAELPTGAVSCSTEDGDDDDVYSLKPLFTGAFYRATKDRKSKKERWDPSRKKPNYFVALQVDDVGVHKAARKVQEHLCSIKPEIVPSLVPTATLHITLLVLCINDDNELQRAKDALQRSHARLKDDFEKAPLTLDFKGLASFGGKVLYVKAADGAAPARLQALADACLEEFTAVELDLSSNKAFRPHLTLAKLSRATGREKVVKKIEEEWYREFAEDDFGSQRVDSVQLLSMDKPKDERGYYYNSLQLDFGPAKETGLQAHDHAECCRPFVALSNTPSPSSSPPPKRQLLQKLESAKEEVKRKMSTLTEAALKKIADQMSLEPTCEGEQDDAPK